MIKTNKISKHFGNLKAVDELSFQVEPGEVLGFLGPNGAGKSTTMKMLAGFLTPTGGSAEILGHDVVTDSLAARRCIGYLPEGAPSYGEMTPLQFLGFIADIRGLAGERKQERIDAVVEHLHLDKVLGQTIDTLSKGFKRRVGLAQAIIHDPRVLILDEPTDGLDPNQKYEVRKLIQSMSEDKIVIISTHILEEVHALCSRAIIIADGKVLADDTPRNLESRSRYFNAVTIGMQEPASIKADIESLKTVASVEISEGLSELTAFPVKGKMIFEDLSQLARKKKWQLDSFSLEAGRLDEVFRSITAGEAN